jgi:hypothetical protein
MSDDEGLRTAANGVLDHYFHRRDKSLLQDRTLEAAMQRLYHAAAAPRDPGVPAAKTHDYDLPPKFLFEAVKAKLHELGLASGDEAVTNQYVEALCGVLPAKGIELLRRAHEVIKGVEIRIDPDCSGTSPLNVAITAYLDAAKEKP